MSRLSEDASTSKLHMHTKPRHAHHQGPRSSKKRNIAQPLASQNTTAACDPSTALPWHAPQKSHNLCLSGLSNERGEAVGLASIPCLCERCDVIHRRGRWVVVSSISESWKGDCLFWNLVYISDVCERFFTSLHVLISLRRIRVFLILLRMLVCV